MTLILGYIAHQAPMIVGDLLLSSQQPEKIILPSGQNTNEYIEIHSGRGITGLRQKVVVLPPNVALAWAGTQFYAKYFISQLIKLHEEKPLTPERLVEYFKSQDEKDLKEVSIFGYIIGPNALHKFAIGEQETSVAGLTHVIAGGSGKETALKVITAVAKPDLDSGPSSVRQNALGHIFQLIGGLLQAEISNGSTLREYYGGAYEIAGIDEQGFTKLQSVTYVFCTETPEGLAPFRVMKLFYHADILEVRSFALDKKTWDRSFVPPVYRTVLASEIEGYIHPLANPDLDSEWICVYVEVMLPNGAPCVGTFIRATRNREKAEVKFDFQDGKIAFIYKDSFLQEVKNSIAAIKAGSAPSNVSS